MDVGGAAGRSQSKALVEFRAGKMHINATNKMVTADKRKGLVSVYRSDDQLMHFTWKDRGTGTLEEDLVINPGDVEFKAVPACTTGRVFILKFRSSNKRMFFWMQEPNTDKDEENCKKVNDILHNLPAPGLPILSLPDETILKVLKSVSPSDLVKVSQTCSKMRIIAEDDKLWGGKCEEENLKDILNPRDLKILGDRIKEKTFNFSHFKANFSKHFRRDMNLTRNPIKPPTVLDGSGDSRNCCLELSDNKIFWVCGNTVQVSCALTGTLLLTLAGHTGFVWTVQMNQDWIVSGSMDKTLRVWSSTTGAYLRTLLGHTAPVHCTHLREDVLVSGSFDKTVRVWDVREGRCLKTLEGHHDWVWTVHFNGSVVASGGVDGVIKIWDPVTANCLLTLHGHGRSRGVKQIELYGNHLVSASIGQSPTVKVWDINTGVCQKTIPVVSIWSADLGAVFTMKDNILVTRHQDNTAKMWDMTTGRHLLTFDGPHKHTSHISSLHVEGKFVVTASWDGSIKLWNSKSGMFIRNLLELEEGEKVLNMKMEDAKIVASAQKPSGGRKIVVLNFDIED